MLTPEHLAALITALTCPAPPAEQVHKPHPADQLIGQFVIIRSRDSGVHAGTLVSCIDRTVCLIGARRLWYWKAAKGHTLSGVALYGLDATKSTIAGEVGEICILDACEILPTTAAAGQSILGAPEYDPA